MERREDLSPELRNFTDDRLPTPISDEETETFANGVEGIDPNAKRIDPNAIGVDPNTKGIDSNTRGIDINIKRVDPSTQLICANIRASGSDTKSIDPIKIEPKSPNSKINSKPVTPLKRITLISQPISPKPTTSNTIFHPAIAASAQTIDPHLRKVDPSPKSVPKVDQNMTFEESNEHLLEFFDRVLCPRNIVMLSASKCQQSDVWEALAIMIVFLLKNDYLCEDSLTEQCLAVYRQDWPQVLFYFIILL